MYCRLILKCEVYMKIKLGCKEWIELSWEGYGLFVVMKGMKFLFVDKVIKIINLIGVVVDMLNILD